jgi:hypothetical protein
MTSSPDVLPSVKETYNLAALAESNYERHRILRYAAAAIGVGLALLLLLFTLESTSNATPLLLDPGRLGFLAASLVVGYFCVSLAWIPFRLLAPPPISVSITSAGLELETVNGKVFRANWSDDRLAGELLVRGIEPASPLESRFRLLIGRGAYDYRVPWRSIPPAAYLTEVCAKRILEAAQSAGVSIERVDNPHSASLVRPGSMTAYLISSSPH